MSGRIRALGVVVLVMAVAVPVTAQSETVMCLRVQANSDVDLTDASAVEEGIGRGEIEVTEVVPCEALAAEAESPRPDTGSWTVLYDETDPTTGDRQVSVYLNATSGVSRLDLPVQLLITCLEHSTRLDVSWGWELGTERIIDVHMQIGDGPVTTEPWFDEGEDTGYGGADPTFIESLFGESRLAVWVTTPAAGQIAAVFDITGIEEAVAGVREACGW